MSSGQKSGRFSDMSEEPIGRSFRFNKPVVLVLGAGSSVEVGYPTSNQLGKEITRCLGKYFNVAGLGSAKLSQHYRGCVELLAQRHSEEDVKQFLIDYSTSSESTLDYFARRNPKYAEIATFFIGYHLLTKANKFSLIAGENDPWQKSFLNRFFVNKKDVTRNQLNVVTFNYDVSFEYFWSQRLLNMGLQKSTELESTVNVKHVYGSLTRALNIYGEDVNDLSFDQVCARYKDIKLIDRSPENGLPKDYWHGIVDSGLSVFFLGFGFDRENVRRLHIDKLLGQHDSQKSPIDITVSTVGIDPNEQAFIHSEFFESSPLVKFTDSTSGISEILNKPLCFKRMS